MIIINYWHEKDYDPTTDGFTLHLAGVINDTLDLYYDPQLIQDCIENDTEFEPKPETLYEIQLIRGTISADPIPEPAFAIDRIVEKTQDADCGWITPLVRM
jgi:hypothetical protein